MPHRHLVVLLCTLLLAGASGQNTTATPTTGGLIRGVALWVCGAGASAEPRDGCENRAMVHWAMHIRDSSQ
jgi:hypothetical protein